MRTLIVGTAIATTLALANPGSAAALNRQGIYHYWSGTVSLDYTEDQGYGSENFQGTATINATGDVEGPGVSSPPDPEIDGSYHWQLYGPVSGTYSGSISCSQNGLTGAEFEQPPNPLPDGGYVHDQGFGIHGPRAPVPGKEYVVGDMSVHLTGEEDCGDGAVPWERGGGFPGRSSLDYFDVHVNLHLPTSGEGGPTSTTGGGLRWQGTRTYTGSSDFATYQATWDYDLTYTDDSSTCELQAKNPQKAGDALVVKVLGRASGCTAKLKAAKLKVGSRVYVFVKKHPERKVAAGKTWRVDIPLKGQALATVRKALKKGQKVKAKAEFDLGDRNDSVVVKIK